MHNNSSCRTCGQSTAMDGPVRAVTRMSKWFDTQKIRAVFALFPGITATIRHATMNATANEHTSTNDCHPVGAQTASVRIHLNSKKCAVFPIDGTRKSSKNAKKTVKMTRANKFRSETPISMLADRANTHIDKASLCVPVS